MDEHTLDIELAFYQKNKEQFLKDHPGKFVLIKGEEVYGFFDTDEQTYDEGIKRFHGESFFIEQILENESGANYPACAVGFC